ncbi:hypothetical protein DFAR_1660003 [Desulfarculales bacterium]
MKSSLLPRSYTISDLAGELKINTRAIRFYKENGLIRLRCPKATSDATAAVTAPAPSNFCAASASATA